MARTERVGHWAHHIRSKSTSENDTGGWGQKRSRTSSACSDGTTTGVVPFRSTRSKDARCNITSVTPLQHLRRLKLAKSIDEVIGLQAKKYSRTDDLGIGIWCIDLLPYVVDSARRTLWCLENWLEQQIIV